MVKGRPLLLVIAAMLGIVGGWMPLLAGVVVNEALVNEPGRATNLEWFELYNDSNQTVDMGSYRAVVGEDTVVIAHGYNLQPHDYLVVCRKLVSLEGSSFEGHWGDSSGVWGDSPNETEITAPVEARFSLVNTGGTIQLLHAGYLVSSFAWSEPGADGCSWERSLPSSQTVNPSVDFDGSTPGFVNSTTPVGQDLGIENIQAEVIGGLTNLTLTVSNRGLQSFPVAHLDLYVAIDSTNEPGDLVDAFTIDALPAGESLKVGNEYLFDGMYVSLVALLADDDRPRNNRRAFKAPATEFPPFQMTEIQPRPTSGAEGEWIEIVNRTDQPYDLAGWRVGDYGRVELITDTSLLVDAGRRVVLARSAVVFAQSYPGFDGLLVQPTGWPGLNDDGDTVLLVDGYDLAADRFAYNEVFEEDYTWCRGEEIDQSDRWGRSDRAGGSPGQVNNVVLALAETQLTVSVRPEVFSPDGDGFEDSVTIKLEGPDTRQYELRIYDRQGRVVKHFDNDSYRRDSYVWHGCSDGGSRLPVGIYIIYCEIEGVGSVKRPIVIAR